MKALMSPKPFISSLSKACLPVLMGAALMMGAVGFSAPAFANGLDAARDAGHVCEAANGLLKKQGGDSDVDALIADVNGKRMEKYKEIAADKSLPLNQVQVFYGETLQKKYTPCN